MDVAEITRTPPVSPASPYCHQVRPCPRCGTRTIFTGYAFEHVDDGYGSGTLSCPGEALPACQVGQRSRGSS